MKKILLFASIAVLFASCSSKPKSELEVNIVNNYSLINKKLIVDQRIDGSVVYTDTIKIKKENFLVSIPYLGPGLIDISIPESNVDNIIMASEEGKIQLNIEGVKPHFSGTPLNDRLQAFNQASDSVSLLFQQIDKEFEAQSQAGLLTPQKGEELTKKRRQLLKENTDRIIAFIKENVDNPVGEYYFMLNYIMYPPERKMELNAFATEKLKAAFGIQQ